jgi:DNA polymerase III delta prime subunit
MTKEAQQALRCLLQNHSNTVRFCLICNYISRIDEGLQNEFLRLRFNQLPEKDIVAFLKNISLSENLGLSDQSIVLIQKLHKSDIRSMINFMQSNQNISDSAFSIIDSDIWSNLFHAMQHSSVKDILNRINVLSIKYNIDKKNIIKDFLNYIIRYQENTITPSFLSFVENIMHCEECKNSYYVNYSIIRLSSFVKVS